MSVSEPVITLRHTLFKRELAVGERLLMDAVFWKAYDEIMAEAGRIRQQRGSKYNRICSVVDYFPNGAHDALFMVRLKGLRAENDIAAGDTESLRETITDLINYAAYTYAEAMAEDAKEDCEAKED